MGTARDILRRKGNQVWYTTPETSVYEALELMAERDVGALVVLDSDELVGVFSERDYARKGILHGRLSRETKVRELMTERVITVSPGNTIEECMRIMTENRIRHLPVLEQRRLVGLVSIGDVVKSIITDQQATIGYLEDYISGRR
jgi:CBS domain-containing protein